MGVSLHIQQVNSEEADIPSVELVEAIRQFELIPWAAEISAWERIPENQKEEHRPLYQLFDDQGHMLRITAYSEQFLGVAYSFPVAGSPFRARSDDEDDFLGTDQFPRLQTSTLIECFFRQHSGSMLSLLGQYPTKQFSDQNPD